MKLESQHIEILKDIESFSDVARYRGMLPASLAMCYSESAIEELVQAQFIERMFISYSCGKESRFFKLTDQGRAELHWLNQGGPHDADARKKGSQRNPDCDELTEEQLQIMSDILHFSKIHRYGGLMPQSETEIYPPQELNRLFARGFVIRVKAELGSGKKRKGLILSDLGLRCLGQD